MSYLSSLWQSLMGLLGSDVSIEQVEARAVAIQECMANALSLVESAVLLFEHGRYAHAAALAVTAHDEVAKVSALVLTEGKRVTRLRSHKKRHILAVCSGMEVNSGASRRMGQVERTYVTLFRQGLERFRQRCVYVDLDGDRVLNTPMDVRSEDSFAVVCGAVECLAEVCSLGFGFEPEADRKIVDLRERLAVQDMGYHPR